MCSLKFQNVHLSENVFFSFKIFANVTEMKLQNDVADNILLGAKLTSLKRVSGSRKYNNRVSLVCFVYLERDTIGERESAPNKKSGRKPSGVRLTGDRGVVILQNIRKRRLGRKRGSFSVIMYRERRIGKTNISWTWLMSCGHTPDLNHPRRSVCFFFLLFIFNFFYYSTVVI